MGNLREKIEIAAEELLANHSNKAEITGKHGIAGNQEPANMDEVSDTGIDKETVKKFLAAQIVKKLAMESYADSGEYYIPSDLLSLAGNACLINPSASKIAIFDVEDDFRKKEIWDAISSR